MISYTNITNTSGDGGTAYRTGAATLAGGRTYCIPWVATARPLEILNEPDPAPKGQLACRSATDCYMVGLKERIQIQTNSGQAWQWRRICVTFRQRTLLNNMSPSFAWGIQTSSGVVRVLNDIFLSTSNAGGTFNDLFWQGKQSVDWSSYFTAKVDSDRFRVHYDKTRILRSGNSSGIMRNVKLWHPMRKTIHYDDEENGEHTDENFYCSGIDKGMGDYYVVDIISAGTGGTSSDLLTFDPEATLYWHER